MIAEPGRYFACSTHVLAVNVISKRCVTTDNEKVRTVACTHVHTHTTHTQTNDTHHIHMLYLSYSIGIYILHQ